MPKSRDIQAKIKLREVLIWKQKESTYIILIIVLLLDVEKYADQYNND
jgi:hypothetical protein